MKTFILPCLGAVVALGMSACAVQNPPGGRAVAGGENRASPPPGWVCPMHGDKCPWMTSRRYCAYYDQHGYTGWRGGGCCRK